MQPVFKTQYQLSYATSNSFVFAMFDLDYFKKINDTYGHVAGDKMLKFFTDTVKKHIINSDIIIRYGGEEFIVILPATQRIDGAKVLEKIREGFENQTLIFDEKQIKATVSIGAMWINPQNVYRKSLLEEYLITVDNMLYSAKNGGRNRVCML